MCVRVCVSLSPGEGGRGQPGWWLPWAGSHEAGDVHRHPCQQRLLEEQQVRAWQCWGSNASLLTAHPLGQLCWCRGIGSCLGDHGASPGGGS